MINVIVRITKSALDSICMSAHSQYPNEIGGVLTGYRGNNGSTYTFDILGSLCCIESHDFPDQYVTSPNTFRCLDNKSWARLIAKAIKIYGHNYIGDWHSHPEHLTSYFSSDDINTITAQKDLHQFDPFPPLHLIAAKSSDNELRKVVAVVLLPFNILAFIQPEVI